MLLPLRVRPLVRDLPAAAEVMAAFTDGRRLFAVPESVSLEVQDHLTRVGFKGEAGETHAVPLAGRPVRVLFAVGTGKKLTSDTIRRGVAAAVQYAKQEGRRLVAVLIPEQAEVAPVEAGRAFAEGALLGNYRFTAYKPELAKRERERSLARVELVVPRGSLRRSTEGVRRATVDVAGTILARDLVNEPSSRLTPEVLVVHARKIVAASRGAVDLTVWNRKECEARGMGAFLAVARGSAEEPAFLHLTTRPGEREIPKAQAKTTAVPRVVLIGKGITFDSGGLSLKSADGMETMKIDMAGAAAVLGVFAVLPKLRLPVEVHGLIAACENMPSGTATKPGDIVRTVSGKTVEILNTDAEGRLTLADALGVARTLKPTAIIDLATLTGACVVSLGEEVAGIFSNDDQLARAVLAAADAAGEPVWRLPLVADYRSQVKSEIADLKNVSTKRWGGAITAALFLREFVGEIPWAHLDIAGPSYAEKQHNPVIPAGGTGFGVRTLLRYLESFV